MTTQTTVKTGFRLLAETFAANGVAAIFLGPDVGSPSLVDAFRAASIRPVVARSGIGAGFMAEATGRLGDGPGIVLVRGTAGAAEAVAGCLVATRDATPTILVVVDTTPAPVGGDVFGSVAKRVFAVAATDRIVETIGLAFATAANGRPGAVVVRLAAAALDATAAAREIRRAAIVETHPGAAEMWDLQKRLWAAERPIVILGGPRWSEKAVRRFARFVDKFDLPVAGGDRRQVLFDHADPHAVGDLGAAGDPALARRVAAADLVLLVGADPATVAGAHEESGRRIVVRVDVEAEDFGRVVAPDLAIHASATAFAAAAEALEPPPIGVAWTAWRDAARTDHETWRAAIVEAVGESRAVASVAGFLAALPAAAIVVDGGDDVAVRLGGARDFRNFGTRMAPSEATAGYGLPAGIAAALARPERPVVVIADAGGFESTAAELATAVEEKAAVIAVVFEACASGRRSPDLAAIARAHGAGGTTIERAEEFGPAFEQALASGAPALLHVPVDRAAVT